MCETLKRYETKLKLSQCLEKVCHKRVLFFRDLVDRQLQITILTFVSGRRYLLSVFFVKSLDFKQNSKLKIVIWKFQIKIRIILFFAKLLQWWKKWKVLRRYCICHRDLKIFLTLHIHIVFYRKMRPIRKRTVKREQ